MLWGAGAILNAMGIYGVAAATKNPYSSIFSTDVDAGLSSLPSTKTGGGFVNKFPEHELGLPTLIPDTKLAKGAGTYNYVVLEDGSLRIGRISRDVVAVI